MSIFTSILGKLGIIGSASAAEVPETTATPPVGETVSSTPSQPSAAVAEITVVDVVAKLENLAANHAEKLNWKVSIVDLLKLLGIDSSLAARKELAQELGCPSEKMGDSAQMNIWLHKTVLKKLAQNGGNIPADLLD